MTRNFDRRLLELAQNKDGNSATIVAHYTKACTFLEHILPKNELRLARLSETNDPRENRGWSLPSIKVKRTENMARDTEAINRHLNVLLCNRSYVACGTRNNVDKSDCYLRPRMWAQYGGNHKGVCLLLNAEVLESKLRSQHLGESDRLYSKPVEYSNVFPFDAPVEINNEPIDQGVEDFLQKEEHRQYFLLQKHTDWKSENEHRWIITKTNDHEKEILVSLKEALLGIVLGVDCPDIECLLKKQYPKIGEVVLGRLQWMYMDAPSVSLNLMKLP